MAVIDAPAEGQRRKGPFYTQLYFQVLFAILAGGLIGAFFPLWQTATVLDPATGQPAIDPATLEPLTRQIAIAEHGWVREYLKPLGDLFIKVVKMIIAPVVFLTIVIGIAGMRDLGKLGRVVFKAFAYFLTFSTLALIVGLVVANVFQPGAGMNIDPNTLDPTAVERVHGYEKQSHDMTILGFISDIVPTTFVGAFTGASILPVLFLAVVFGISLASVGERGQPAVDVLTAFSTGVFKMVAILMRAAPIGAFGAFAFIIADQGVGAIAQLAKLIGAVWLTSLVFVLVVLGAVGLWAGFNIFRLIRYLKEELFLVLGTSSSESALPALMEKMERAGCARPVVGLVVPTGYSFNLDGTNIYMTLAALFIAQATNTPLGLNDQIILLLVAMLSSKGAAGVTGAGFITLAATLAVFPSIPIAGMAIILGVDRFLSECRALTNFIGNAVATIVVSRWEGALDRDRLRAAMNGAPLPLAAAPIERDTD
ncbi:MAG TPA: dicarboxylate/amino acid:cation symporter [Hyphomonadaceae bacterium]|nr:dicarboxylate/amino acid:cation symporter [Hyphomonadaceae bacterium]